MNWYCLRGRGSLEFGRRSARYSELDIRTCGSTRFFAAAALINAAFSSFFRFLPIRRTRYSFIFLNEAGAALEVANQVFFRQINGRPGGASVDHVLVYAEQARLQRFVQSLRSKNPHEWEAVRSELNGMLNGRYSAAVFSQLGRSNRRVCRVLRDVQKQLGAELDFASQSHRVRIGLGLIEHIRSAGWRSNAGL